MVEFCVTDAKLIHRNGTSPLMLSPDLVNQTAASLTSSRSNALLRNSSVTANGLTTVLLTLELWTLNICFSKSYVGRSEGNQSGIFVSAASTFATHLELVPGSKSLRKHHLKLENM